MNNIRVIRQQNGITQEQLAQSLGIDRSAVAKWETGKASPRADILPRIAILCKCSIDDLFLKVEEKK